MDSRLTTRMDALTAYHHVFWMGDLNYRWVACVCFLVLFLVLPRVLDPGGLNYWWVCGMLLCLQLTELSCAWCSTSIT